MMRIFGKVALTLGTLSLLASPALAQGRGGFGGGGAGFLTAPNVQKDLKLTDAQVGKVQETLQAVREKHQDEYAALRDASPEERRAKTATLSKAVVEEVKKALTLSADQATRFDQIGLQARGSQAFADPSVAAKLNLTDDQKAKAREIVAATRGSLAGALNKDSSQSERAEARKAMAATQKENLVKVLALLTVDQKKAWKELTGEPIEIQYPARRVNN